MQYVQQPSIMCDETTGQRRLLHLNVKKSTVASQSKAIVVGCTSKSYFRALIAVGVLLVLIYGNFSSLRENQVVAKIRLTNTRSQFRTLLNTTTNHVNLLECSNPPGSDTLGLPPGLLEFCRSPRDGDTDRLSCEVLTCRNLLVGKVSNRNETLVNLSQIAIDFMKTHPDQRHLSDFKMAESTADCDQYRKSNGFNDVPIWPEAVDFPLAYNLIVHQDAHQVARLLRAIYRPQNVYCIHIDTKSSSHFHAAIRSLVNCFDNVHMATKMENIVYAGFSRLQADINCMRDHLNGTSSGVRWRYLINTAGQAFPLRTNEEIVSILRLYNGTNDIEGVDESRTLKHRYRKRWAEKPSQVLNSSTEFRYTHPINTGRKNRPAPHGLTVVKGLAYGAFSREFVQFIFDDHRARDLLAWSRSTYSPDEFYWSTLHHTFRNSHLATPGGFTGYPSVQQYLSVFVVWDKVKCRGLFVRGVCVYGVGDLPMLVRQPHLFANKFYSHFEPLALDCLEAWLRHKETCLGRQSIIDVDLYGQLLAPMSWHNKTVRPLSGIAAKPRTNKRKVVKGGKRANRKRRQ